MIWCWKKGGEGNMIPRWYLGHTYRDFDLDLVVYHVIPFNIIIALWRYLLMIVRWRITGNLREKTATAIYQRGFRDGVKSV